MKRFLGVFALATAVIGTNISEATELFRDALESSVGWGVNSTGDTSATFGFDYSVSNLSIPEAPNTQVGDASTTGLLAQANIVSPAAGESFIAYPIGESFSGSYQLRFDAWINFDADNFYNNGAAGTTEFIGGGLGYNDTDNNVGSGAQIIATGEGGSGSDWRAFADGAFLSTGEMVAGTRNGFDPYYSDFLPSVSPPAGQAQTAPGDSIAGSPGFQWVTFEVNTANGKSAVFIEKPGGDRLHITTINRDGSRPYTSDGNIGLFYADFFSSVSSAPQMQFGLFDNVVVTQIPEPMTASLILVGLGLVAGCRRR
ncbi:MAG: PEP-CTERM sorting domain-containing protein [Lacipirellulaceae bacterium]